MLILYLGDHHFSSWSMRARLAVLESGVDHVERVVELDWPATTSGDGPLLAGDGRDGREPAAACACTWSTLRAADHENRLPDTVAELMPQVPLLVDRDVVVTGSLDIGRHVDALGAGTRLFGLGDLDRTSITSLCTWAQNDLGALVNEAPYALSLRPSSIGSMSPGATDQADWVCEVIAERLHASGGPYLVGGFSMADVMLAPVVQQLVGWRHPVNSAEVNAYVARMLARPSVARHLADARRPYELIAAAPIGTPQWVVRHYRYHPGLRLLHDWQAGTSHLLANHSARRAVELAYDGLDIPAIADRIAAEFSAPAALVTRDVAALFEQLRPTTPDEEGLHHDDSRRAAHPPLPVA